MLSEALRLNVSRWSRVEVSQALRSVQSRLVAHLGSCDVRDLRTLVVVCAAGVSASFLLFTFAAPFVLSLLIAAICSLPAALLYWLGMLGRRARLRSQRAAAEAEFGVQLRAVARAAAE